MLELCQILWGILVGGLTAILTGGINVLYGFGKLLVVIAPIVSMIFVIQCIIEGRIERRRKRK